MFGLKSVFETLGYIHKESQYNLINLLYLSGCFERNQLQRDLKAAEFSREEITSIDEQLKEVTTHDRANWNTFYQKFSVPFFTSAADDAAKYGKIFNWLNLVTKRILPGANGALTRQRDWLKEEDTVINELANRVAEIEYEATKANLTRKHNKFSAILVVGGSASQMIASSHCLKSLTYFEPLSTSVFYLPHQRQATYAIDGNAATRLPLIVKDREVQTEEGFADSLAKKMKKHLHNMNNLYPQADASLPSSSQRPSAPRIELPKIDITVISPFNLNDTHAVLLNFASKHNELLKSKILIISNVKDLQKHKEQAQKVFGEWVTVEAIPAYQNKLEVLQALGARVQGAYDNFLKQQQEQRPAKSRLPKSTIGKVGLFGAAVALVAGATYAVVSNKETLSEWISSPSKR